MKSIYELGLHEAIEVRGDGIDTEIRRVPGGWIYNLMTKAKSNGAVNWISTPVFVPYNNDMEGSSAEAEFVTVSSVKDKIPDDSDRMGRWEEPEIFKGRTPK
jgi:hypothetical protein